MSLATYTALKASIASWLVRGDLTAVIPDLITLCEDDLDRPVLNEDGTVRHAAVSYEVNTTLALATEEVDLPAACREPRSLYLDETVAREPLILVSDEIELAEFKVTFGPTGIPRAAALIANGTKLRLAPAPDASRTAKFTYIAKLTRLSGSVATNWVLDSHHDVYLYGSLVHSAPYLKDDERLAVWRSLYDRARGGLDEAIRRRKVSLNTLVMRPKRPIP